MKQPSCNRRLSFISLWKRFFTCILLLILMTCVILSMKQDIVIKETLEGIRKESLWQEVVKLPPFEELMKGPYSIPQDDPRLVEILRQEYLHPPSNQPYNLTNPEIEDPSQWQTKEILKLLKNKKNGYFIECGAFTGEYFSNSLYLERYMGWKGLLIEPDPVHYSELVSKNRKSWTAQLCLSPNTYPNKVLFQRNGWASAIASYSVQKEKEEFISVQCVPLYSILLASNVTKIDYFSLDVEAVELHVLKTIPWDKVNITTISVEVQFLGNKKKTLVKYMKKLGYKLYTDVTALLRTDIIDYIFYHPLLLN